MRTEVSLKYKCDMLLIFNDLVLLESTFVISITEIFHQTDYSYHYFYTQVLYRKRYMVVNT